MPLHCHFHCLLCIDKDIEAERCGSAQPTVVLPASNWARLPAQEAATLALENQSLGCSCEKLWHSKRYLSFCIGILGALASGDKQAE